MRLAALIVTLSLVTAPALADKYDFDKSHTTIMFYVNHLGLSDMVGVMTEYDGSFTFDQQTPEKSSVDVSIRPTGIRTSSDELDKKLQNTDFFNTEKFPEIRFVSKKIDITGERTGNITGDLTLLGVTKPATLKVTFNKADYHPFTQYFVAGFSATTTIKRSEFGMSNLIPMVGDEVRLEIQTEGINLDRKKAETVKH